MSWNDNLWPSPLFGANEMPRRPSAGDQGSRIRSGLNVYESRRIERQGYLGASR